MVQIMTLTLFLGVDLEFVVLLLGFVAAVVGLVVVVGFFVFVVRLSKTMIAYCEG